ncbi:OprD family outer membrane porin [Flavihumibacter stibioxidans]|uniref:Outer membrane porin, OprD family n=1 Tax=Flavihumibacter stibioxidans TaxID=1834163 RepID=A0ABR7M5P5_9BACT|nr:OprD family outer membrane porin [Flavihumibacter stibioxidans]MBC6490241.1 hypothetical protein [Flavihumibacter stibioxidans]
MKRIFKFLFTFIIITSTRLQAQEEHPQPDKKESDTTSILHAFKKGHIHGHFRYFFMATDNASGLTDYYANALGGGIKYETAPFKGFQLGVGGFFIYNIGSSDLATPDPASGAANRYELGLFDIQDPENKNDIDRLEELYLKYNFRKSDIIAGKQLPEMPFINQQDGRMRPTEMDGAMVNFREFKNTTITAGYLWQISPRSTVEWFSIGESIGVYSMGVAVDGTPSNYRNQLESGGIAVLGIQRKIGKHLTVQLWEQYVDNIFNTAMVQADLVKPLNNRLKLTAGLQLIRQDAINDGGNEDPSKTYFEKGSKSYVWGLMAGVKDTRWDASLNYTRITKDGRYLMPREWGKDPFYTFLPRERNEGNGDLDAVVAKFSYAFPRVHLKSTLGYGHYYLAEVTNTAHNKYGLPSYNQLNATLKYDFQKVLKGFDAQFIYVYKGGIGKDFGNPKYIINKVDKSHFNLIINYNF